MWIELEINRAKLLIGPRCRPMFSPAYGLGGWCLGELSARAMKWEGVIDARGQSLPPSAEAIAQLPAGLAQLLAKTLSTPPPWEQELAEFRGWVQAKLEYPELECMSCVELCEEEAVAPPCESCPLPPAPSWAAELVRLWQEIKRLPPEGGRILLQQALEGLEPPQVWVVLKALAELGEVLAKPKYTHNRQA